MDEGIALMRAVWSQDPVTFPTRHIPAIVAEMRMLPHPVRPIPIWIGGSSEPALARAVRLADGGTARACRPSRPRRWCGVCANSVPSRNLRFRCATAGTAKTMALYVPASPPMARPGSSTSWSNLPSAGWKTGCIIKTVTSVPIDANTVNSQVALSGLLDQLASAAGGKGGMAKFAGMKIYGITIDFDLIPADTQAHRDLRDGAKRLPTSSTLTPPQLDLAELLARLARNDEWQKS